MNPVPANLGLRITVVVVVVVIVQAQGIVFLDIFPILRDPVAFEVLITHLVHHITSSTTVAPVSSGAKKVDVVVGLDARGFLLGPIIAQRLGECSKAARHS